MKTAFPVKEMRKFAFSYKSFNYFGITKSERNNIPKELDETNRKKYSCIILSDSLRIIKENVADAMTSLGITKEYQPTQWRRTFAGFLRFLRNLDSSNIISDDRSAPSPQFLKTSKNESNFKLQYMCKESNIKVKTDLSLPLVMHAAPKQTSTTMQLIFEVSLWEVLVTWTD
jgi:hypothetical protein